MNRDNEPKHINPLFIPAALLVALHREPADEPVCLRPCGSPPRSLLPRRPSLRQLRLQPLGRHPAAAGVERGAPWGGRHDDVRRGDATLCLLLRSFRARR